MLDQLSAMVLQWPDAKLAVLLFTHLPHACRQDTVCRLQYQSS